MQATGHTPRLPSRVPHLPRTPSPAMRRWHMSHASAHAVSPRASTTRTPPTAPHTATRDTPVAHATRVGACRIAARLYRTHTSPPRPTQLPAIRRCHMPHVSAHAVSPHASTALACPSTTPHTATRDTPVPHATHVGACRIAARLYRTHTSPPRPAQLPAMRRCHMPHTSAHDVSPHASTARSRPSTAPHTATRDTPVPHATHVGACRIATRLDRMLTPLHRAPHSYPRYAGATCHTRRRMT